MSTLKARGLHKSFPKHTGPVDVLRGVDLDLRRGEAIAVVGPSGSGKSTLLNLLGGLDQPDSGIISYDERVLYDGPPPPPPPWWNPLARTAFAVRSVAQGIQGLDRRRPSSRYDLTHWRRGVVGFVFQYHFLLPDFTARENLLVPVRLLRDPDPQDHQRADELLAAMDLTRRADHRPGELSGGEQQRVAVARAFMNRPRIVLADEPFGNLDREKGTQLGELLFTLRDREGVSLVIVTHDPELARRADRTLELHDGGLRPFEEMPA